MPHHKVNDGTKIYYESKGSKGETILLLRGLARSSQYWLGFDEKLARDYRVITLDFRGTGKSEINISWPFSIGDLAEDCIEVLDKLSIGSCYIVGHSLGGMVAASMFAKRPELVEGLMMVNSSIAGPVPRINPMSLAQLLGARGDANKFQSILFDCLSIDTDSKSKVVPKWEALWKAEGVSARLVLKQVAAAAAFRLPAILRQSDLRPWVICGRKDRFVPSLNSRYISRKIKAVHYRELDGGHELFLDCENELLEIISKEFVRAERESPSDC